ncbi:MAG: hypothetical protein WCO55_00595 [Candidatus Falkowbacteria bacterium]
MNIETKLTILFAVLVIGLTGSVFAYLASSNWPDVDTNTLNLHLIRAIKSDQQKAEAELQQYVDAKLGVSFKYPGGWKVAVDATSTSPTLLLTSGDKKVVLVKYANPKMRKTLPEYLEAKLSKKADVDYKNLSPLTVGGKEAYKITLTEAGGALTEYDQVWVKASDTLWIAVGNLGAPQDTVNSVVSSLAFTK